MLADLLFRKGDFESSTYHFQQLLEKQPTHYTALIRLIHLLRRSGKLNEISRYLKMADQYSKKASLEPGLHYAKGLYYRYYGISYKFFLV